MCRSRTPGGVHPSVFLRAIIELRSDTGLIGLGETYGAARTLEGLRTVAPKLDGLDPWNLRARVDAALPDAGGVNAPTALADHKVVDVVYSAFEIACLDLIGHEVERPLHDLLGGAVRREIPFGGYLFFLYAKQDTTFGPDILGEVMTPDALVEEARWLVRDYGFKSLKLEGGVLEPDLEVGTLLKLREAFPRHPSRIDPMGAWTVPTALRMIDAVGDTAGGLPEYLEEPVRGIDAMAELSAQTDMPLATNLVVVEFEQVIEAVRKDAVKIVLSDRHSWRGAVGRSALARCAVPRASAFRCTSTPTSESRWPLCATSRPPRRALLSIATRITFDRRKRSSLVGARRSKTECCGFSKGRASASIWAATRWPNCTTSTTGRWSPIATRSTKC